MSTPRAKDDALVASLAEHLFDVMPMFPQRLIRRDELIHAFGMPLSHMHILILLEKGDMSIGQLSARTGVAKPNVTPLVDALRDRGYVSRTRNSEDRRMVNVHLEEEGAECLRKLREAVADQIRKWPKGITRSELRSLAASLETLSGVMNAFDEAQRT